MAVLSLQEAAERTETSEVDIWRAIQLSRDAHIKCSFRMRVVAPRRPQVLAATKSVDALSALHLRSAAAFRASAVWTILSASLPSSRRMGGSSILTTLRITWAALAGSPGCLPL